MAVQGTDLLLIERSNTLYRASVADMPAGGLSSATLTHTTGTISVDLSAADYFEFVADVYTPSQASFIASKTTSTTGLPVSLPGTPQEGDTVAIFNLGPYTQGGGFSISTSGYTQRYVWGARNNSVFTKVMGSTPDTDVEFSGINSGGVLVVLFRGVDTTSPLDVATTQAENWSASTTVPDPPAITTVTDESIVFAAIIDNSDMVTSGAAPAGYTKVHGATINSAPSASFYKLVSTAGTEDPGTFSSATGYWAAFTTAWRAGAASGEKDYTVNLSNIPAAGSLIEPKILMLETKTDVGTWTFNNIDQWIGGAAPTMNTIGLHAIRLWAGDGQVTAEYLGGP